MNAQVKLVANLDNPTGDRMLISDCAKFVRRRIGEMHGAEIWLACGEELKRLRNNLKDVPKGSNERVNWQQAFKLVPREFPFGKRHADKLILIYENLSGPRVAQKKLPVSIRALDLLATKFKSEQIEQCIADGSISPGSTETEVKELGKKLGLITSDAKKKKAEKEALKKLPKRERIELAWEYIAALGLKIDDLVNHD